MSKELMEQLAKEHLPIVRTFEKWVATGSPNRFGAVSGEYRTIFTIDATAEQLEAFAKAYQSTMNGQGLSETFINEVSQEIAELPDRTSPDDWPEAMLVTHDELKEIMLGVHEHIPAFTYLPDAQATAPIDNVAEALKEASQMVRDAAHGFNSGNAAIVMKSVADSILELIPNTQAKKGE
jgi:hypothetical protein